MITRMVFTPKFWIQCLRLNYRQNSVLKSKLPRQLSWAKRTISSRMRWMHWMASHPMSLPQRSSAVFLSFRGMAVRKVSSACGTSFGPPCLPVDSPYAVASWSKTELLVVLVHTLYPRVLRRLKSWLGDSPLSLALQTSYSGVKCTDRCCPDDSLMTLRDDFVTKVGCCSYPVFACVLRLVLFLLKPYVMFFWNWWRTGLMSRCAFLMMPY